MKTIVAVVRDILKCQSSFLHVEEQLLKQVSVVVCQTLTQELETLDYAICQQAHVRILRQDSRSLTTLFGTLTFKRRLVETNSGAHVYLLDRQLGLIARQRESPYLEETVADLGTRDTYRAVAQAISRLTPVSVSHQQVGHILHTAGQQVDRVRRAESVVRTDETFKKRQVPTLYITGDAFLLRRQQRGLTAVYRLQVAEGVSGNGKRHALINRHSIATTTREQAFKELEAYLAQHYDLTRTLVLTSSDNGSGFEPDKFEDVLGITGEQHHVLDSYHLNRKLKERLAWLPSKALLNKLRNAVYRADKVRIDACLDTIEALQDDHQDPFQADHIADVQHLRNYLNRNWHSIEPFGDQHLAGRLHCLGSCETNHRRYTYRMKRQGRSWGQTGLLAMIRLIDCEQNRNLRASLTMSGINDDRIAPELKYNVAQLSKQSAIHHEGVRHGAIFCDSATSTAMGQLAKQLGHVIGA
jgi:hypothetical protein